MDACEEKTGGDVLAIAHAGNVPNGPMFPLIQPFTDLSVDEACVEARAKSEPVCEVTRRKGDGEAHPFLSPDDGFADFETWEKGNLNLGEGRTPGMRPHEYARSALLPGMQLGQQFGTNPCAFGMVGSTDPRTGLPAVEADNVRGKLAPMKWEVSSAGHAAVRAVETTRASIFAAMERREVHATTGTRITVRFFGGYGYGPSHAASRRPAAKGCSTGVPMGGEIGPDPQGRAPGVLVAALRDPDAALDDPRRGALRHRPAAGSPGDGAGPGLFLAGAGLAGGPRWIRAGPARDGDGPAREPREEDRMARAFASAAGSPDFGALRDLERACRLARADTAPIWYMR